MTSAQDDGQYLQGAVVDGPYKTAIVEGAELSVVANGDADFPLSLVLGAEGSDGVTVRQLVDKYDFAGSAPKVESIFFIPSKM